MGEEGADAATTTARDRTDLARRPGPLYAAIDLGTNNCRLLIGAPSGRGFRVVESFSRIVRLGEDLARTGRLSEAAMDRATAALRVCAGKVRRREVRGQRAVATQACRAATNGAAFLARVRDETGLSLEVITPEEEARLAVAGCCNLLDPEADAALVLDVGGGSTELSWVDLRDGGGGAPRGGRWPIHAWLSIPIGVVTLAERFPEDPGGREAWFRAMVGVVRAELDRFGQAEAMRPSFAAGRAHLVGTSGAITSLAGLHLGLARYDRSRVDGLWLTDADCEGAARRLLALEPAARAAQPCIGRDRADLVLAGAAILQAVQEAWPCRRVRVADRGLREGMLLAMTAERPGRRRRRAAGTRYGAPAAPSAP